MSGPTVVYIAAPQMPFPGGDLGELEFTVVGPAPPSDAASLLETHAPDAVLLDVDVDPSAYDVLLQLHEATQPCRSVLVGDALSEAIVREAFFVGVYGCLRKPLAPTAVRAALHRAAEGTAVMRRCLDAVSNGPSTVTPGDRLDTSSLTPREREILELLLDGRTTPAMAAALQVSPRTVKFHVGNLLRKLGFASRLALLANLRRDEAFARFETG